VSKQLRIAAAASTFAAGCSLRGGHWRKAAWPAPFLASHTAYLRLWVLTALAGAVTFATRVGIIVSIANPREAAFGPAHFVLLEGLTALLFAPIAGVLIDRVSPRLALVGTEFTRAAGLAVFVLLPSPLLFPVLVPFLASCSVVHQASRDACVLDTVQVAEAPRASGLDQVAGAVAIIVGPLLGSGLVLGVGLRMTVAALVVAHVGLAILAYGLPSRHRTKPDGLEVTGRMFLPRASLSNVSYLSLAVFVWGALGGSLWLAAAPLMMIDVFHTSAAWLGVQMTVAGIAGVFGALAVPMFVVRHGPLPIMIATALIEAVGMGLYAASPSIAFANIAVGVVGWAAGSFISAFYAYLQASSCEQDRGRLFALVRQLDAAAVAGAGVIALSFGSGGLAAFVLFAVAAGYFCSVMALLWRVRIGRHDHARAAP
jgi:predicted MFS family arabinose efflux permease